jgi:Sigma-70, region 4
VVHPASITGPLKGTLGRVQQPANSVGLAMLVVLETLAPAERIAFVLHDTFDLSFEEIAPIVGRSPTAARQLASRARRRVQGTGTVPDADLTSQREVVDAFLAAAAAATSTRFSRCSTQTLWSEPTVRPCLRARRRRSAAPRRWPTGRSRVAPGLRDRHSWTEPWV